YNLINFQCYWHSHTVWETIKWLFPSGHESGWEHGCACFHGVKMDKADSIEGVCEEYCYRILDFAVRTIESHLSIGSYLIISTLTLSLSKGRCDPIETYATCATISTYLHCMCHLHTL
ncbi:hypothetical protein DEU56DRAFT_740135, partial [Suillus clintonianus]|uniref:uncharacterized protein n=1 Tax=Suillus clintonianus TaxID=1904413 RepID=UPI001B8629D1